MVMADSTARLFTTGSVPGKAMDTGSTNVFGDACWYPAPDHENILLLVLS